MWKPTTPWPWPRALPGPPRGALTPMKILGGWIVASLLWAFAGLLASRGFPPLALVFLYGLLIPFTVLLSIATAALGVARRRARTELIAGSFIEASDSGRESK